MKNKSCLKLTVAALPLVCGAAPAFAQEEAGKSNEEIVITAQRREQALIDVPASVSAFSGEKLQDLNITQLPDVATQVPNFSIVYERGRNTTPNFTLRGIRGDGLISRFNESSIAIYTDDVFLGDETMLNALMFDIGRLEVLRGPQGTLFGKNTTGGLVHFISAKPTKEVSGYANFQYGSDMQTAVEGAVSGPLSDRIRFRLSGRWERDNGHYKNEFLGAGENGVEKNLGDANNWGLRGIIDIDLTSNTLLRLIAAYAENNGQSAPGRALGGLPPGTVGRGPFTRAQVCTMSQVLAGECVSFTQTIDGGLPVVGREPGHGITNLPPDDLEIRGRFASFTGILTHDFDWATLTSVTNYSSGKWHIEFDGDYGLTPSIGRGLDILAFYTNKSHQFSQELRLNGSKDAFDWVMGAFYYSDNKNHLNDVFFRNFGFGQHAEGEVDTRSHALFGQIDAHLSDQFTLSIGGRYTGEKRELVRATTNGYGVVAPPLQNIQAAVPDPSTNDKDFTGKFSLSWEPNDDSTYYISYSRGIKGAGFSSGYSPTNSLATNVRITGPVGQEKLDAFEIGSKNRFLDRKLMINAAAFFYNFDGKQENLTTFDGFTSQQNYLNVGTARIYGVEGELTFTPDEHWDFSLNGGLLHSKITKSEILTADPFGILVPLEGKELAQTPNWTFSTVLAYHIPSSLGEFTPQLEVRGLGGMSYSIINDPLAEEPAHVFVNFRLLWESPDGRFNAQAFLTNVFEEKYAARRNIVSMTTGSLHFAEGEGRLWGVKFETKF